MLLCKPTFKDTIHSSHLTQLYPFFNAGTCICPNNSKIYGDDDMNLSIIRKTGELGGRTCELQIGRQVRYMYR